MPTTLCPLTPAIATLFPQNSACKKQRTGPHLIAHFEFPKENTKIRGFLLVFGENLWVRTNRKEREPCMVLKGGGIGMTWGFFFLKKSSGWPLKRGGNTKGRGRRGASAEALQNLDQLPFIPVPPTTRLPVSNYTPSLHRLPIEAHQANSTN